MTRSTSPLAITALCLGLLVPAAPSQAQTAPATDATRTCRGDVLTLGWGAVVRDRDGPCRRVAARRPATATVRSASVRPTLVCPDLRSYLGGAIQVCDTPRRPQAPR